MSDQCPRHAPLRAHRCAVCRPRVTHPYDVIPAPASASCFRLGFTGPTVRAATSCSYAYAAARGSLVGIHYNRTLAVVLPYCSSPLMADLHQVVFRWCAPLHCAILILLRRDSSPHRPHSEASDVIVTGSFDQVRSPRLVPTPNTHLVSARLLILTRIFSLTVDAIDTPYQDTLRLRRHRARPVGPAHLLQIHRRRPLDHHRRPAYRARPYRQPKQRLQGPISS